MDKNQKKVWVTGASAGIGKAVAEKFAKENWKVAVSARSTELLDEMAKNENIVKAINRNVRSSPRKINLLLKDIRGKKADIVIRDLSFARKRIAFDIKKTVEAAIANAENNFQYDIDNLYVKEAYVGKSIVLKRFRARAKGRASGIKKPYSNLTIILSENINQKKELHGTKS